MFAESYQFSVPESLPVASVVAKIKALDADVGPNAEMEYRIIEGDGLGVFRVEPDKDTQEGVITLLKVSHAPDLAAHCTQKMKHFFSMNMSILVLVNIKMKTSNLFSAY